MSGVMVSVVTWSVVDKGLECRLGQAKDWLARNQDNVTGWGDMPIRRPLFQLTCTIKIQLSVLVS